VITTLSNETRMLFFTAPVIRCPGGMRITADSARVYESTNYNQLWGNVVFEDQNSRLTADQAQYFADQRRLVAQGNAVLTDIAEGSVISGDNMTLIRAGPDREEDFLTVTGRRPHATLYPALREAGQTPPDTTGATVGAIPPDTAALEPDTAGAALDPAVAASDTTAAPDSLGVVADTAASAPDSAGAQPDTTVAGPDSAAVAADPSRVQPDTLRVPGEGGPPSPLVQEAESQAEPEPEIERKPYEIDAQRFVLEGTRYFRATGSVVVTRDSLDAVADSLEYDQDQGSLFLSEDARVTTADTDLSANTIRLAIPQEEVREALAEGDAILIGEDLRLLAPIVTLFFTQGQMDMLVARRDPVADSLAVEEEAVTDPEPPEWGREDVSEVLEELNLELFPVRPYAMAQDFLLEGDSLEVLTPGQVLKEVWAMGAARGESTGRDTLNTPDTPELIARDWLEGDTIVAFFGEGQDSLAAGEEPLPEPETEVIDADTTETHYRLERLETRVQARSMYRMAPSDSTLAEDPGRFAIHYVVGDQITIILNEEGEAERMEVEGQTRGIHLEPIPGASGVPDTLLGPDTLSGPDTLNVPETVIVPDTTRLYQVARLAGAVPPRADPGEVLHGRPYGQGRSWAWPARKRGRSKE
jgi:lipopolysaccharide export system protein LptA